MSSEPDLPRATFTQLKGITAEAFEPLRAWTEHFRLGLADRLLATLASLEGDHGGFPIDRLQHSLQTATRAFQGGEDEEYVVCALVHDIGDNLAFYNHAELAGVIVEPFVSEANHWMVKNHGPFQGYYYWQHIGRDPLTVERFRGHPHFERTWIFADKYDQPAFDPDFETMPLAAFAPMVQRVFARPKPELWPGAPA